MLILHAMGVCIHRMSFDHRRNSTPFENFARQSGKPQLNKDVKVGSKEFQMLEPRVYGNRDIGRFWANPEDVLQQTKMVSLYDHLECILTNAVERCDLLRLPTLRPEAIQVFRDYYLNVLLHLYTFVEEMSLDSVLLTAYIYFKHSVIAQVDYSHADFELLICFILMATKVQEIHPPRLERLLFETFNYVCGRQYNGGENLINEAKERILRYESLVFKDLNCEVHPIPFFFLFDYLIALERRPLRDTEQYTRVFFNDILAAPMNIFCRQNGFLLSILELVDTSVQQQTFQFNSNHVFER